MLPEYLIDEYKTATTPQQIREVRDRQVRDYPEHAADISRFAEILILRAEGASSAEAIAAVNPEAFREVVVESETFNLGVALGSPLDSLVRWFSSTRLAGWCVGMAYFAGLNSREDYEGFFRNQGKEPPEPFTLWDALLYLLLIIGGAILAVLAFQTVIREVMK